MKTDRFARAAALVLAGLLLAASQYAGGQTITFRFGTKGGSRQSAMSAALAQQIGEAQKRFERNRSALRSVKGPDGKPVFSQEEVAGLITDTQKDLDQAIEKVEEPGLDAMRAWVDDEFRRIQEELAPADTAPRAVAVVASLEGFSLAANTAAPKQGTIAAERSNRLLDWAGEVGSRIFLLAKKDDLEVDLWVGSTPTPQATFRFWSQGRIQGAAPAATIVQANSKRKRVLRGLYAYRATQGEGPVTECIAYPPPDGAPEAGQASERLDLVKGSSFFCCQFNKQYCRHVDSEKECR